MNAGTQPHTLAYTCRADTSCSHARLRVSMSPAGTGGTKDCMGTGTCAWGCDAGRRDAGPPKLKQRAHFGAEAMASGVGCLCMYTSPCAEQPSQVFFFTRVRGYVVACAQTQETTRRMGPPGSLQASHDTLGTL